MHLVLLLSALPMDKIPAYWVDSSDLSGTTQQPSRTQLKNEITLLPMDKVARGSAPKDKKGIVRTLQSLVRQFRRRNRKQSESHLTFLKSIPEVKKSPTVSPSNSIRNSPLTSNEGDGSNEELSSTSSRSAFGLMDNGDFDDNDVTTDCIDDPNCVYTDSLKSRHKQTGSLSIK